MLSLPRSGQGRPPPVRHTRTGTVPVGDKGRFERLLVTITIKIKLLVAKKLKWRGVISFCDIQTEVELVLTVVHSRHINR